MQSQVKLEIFESKPQKPHSCRHTINTNFLGWDQLDCCRNAASGANAQRKNITNDRTLKQPWTIETRTRIDGIDLQHLRINMRVVQTHVQPRARLKHRIKSKHPYSCRYKAAHANAQEQMGRRSTGMQGSESRHPYACSFSCHKDTSLNWGKSACCLALEASNSVGPCKGTSKDPKELSRVRRAYDMSLERPAGCLEMNLRQGVVPPRFKSWLVYETIFK